MVGHEYNNKASFEGKDVFYYNLPEDILRRFVRKEGYADSREATIYFRGAKTENVTIYDSRTFESGNPDLVLGNIENIIIDVGKSSFSTDDSKKPETGKSEKSEKKSLWQRLLGR